MTATHIAFQFSGSFIATCTARTGMTLAILLSILREFYCNHLIGCRSSTTLTTFNSPGVLLQLLLGSRVKSLAGLILSILREFYCNSVHKEHTPTEQPSFNSPGVLLQRMSWRGDWSEDRSFQFSGSFIATCKSTLTRLIASGLSILREFYCNDIWKYADWYGQIYFQFSGSFIATGQLFPSFAP